MPGVLCGSAESSTARCPGNPKVYNWLRLRRVAVAPNQARANKAKSNPRRCFPMLSAAHADAVEQPSAQEVRA
jgi:hypothetical protein